jgi:hypothetical protein
VKPKRAAVINTQEDKNEDQAVPVPALVVKVDKSTVSLKQPEKDTTSLKVKEHAKATSAETLEDDQRDSGDFKKRPRKKKLEDIAEQKRKAVDGDGEVSKKMLQSQEVILALTLLFHCSGVSSFLGSLTLPFHWTLTLTLLFHWTLTLTLLFHCLGSQTETREAKRKFCS